MLKPHERCQSYDCDIKINCKHYTEKRNLKDITYCIPYVPEGEVCDYFEDKEKPSKRGHSLKG